MREEYIRLGHNLKYFLFRYEAITSHRCTETQLSSVPTQSCKPTKDVDFFRKKNPMTEMISDACHDVIVSFTIKCFY